MKIVFAAIGSYGDINPYLSIAQELLRRGHRPVVATSDYYREAIEKTGVKFATLHPDARVDDIELVKKAMDPNRGSEFIVRELVMPVVSKMYADLERSAADADMLVSHMLTYAVPLYAEKTGKPWVSTTLAPLSFLSRYDVPVFPPAPWLAHMMRPLGPAVNGAFLRLIKKVSYSWSEPVRRLRAELGLPKGKDPLWEGQHSPHGVLALFSKHFAAPQADWPANTTICGFPFVDAADSPLDAELADFLKMGEPPLVFTLGSSAVMAAGDFYRCAMAASLKLKRRAVLVAGAQAEALSKELPPTIKAIKWASFPPLFQRAAVVVHPGGIGTTAQALRSGRPQLVVPFANDQFDNADHIARLGVGRVLYRGRVTAPRLAHMLEPLIGHSVMANNATRVGELIRSENGVHAACKQIERSFL